MAKVNDGKLNLLTPEQKVRLQELSQLIDDAEKRLNLLKELGIGVSVMQEKLDWAKKRKDILLAKG